jgi:hypothetical protein
MAQEHTNNHALRLTARYTIKRVNLHNMAAMTQQLSRKQVILDIDNTTVCKQIQIDDLVELEIGLPVLLGFPQRHIYCRCRVSEISADSIGTHLGLEIDTIRIRDEEFTKGHSSPTNLLM